MDKNKKILTIVVIIAVIITIVALIITSVIDKNKAKKEKFTKQAVETLINDTQNQVGGEIIGDGYYITYEKGMGRFIITVTNDPFIENQKKGEDYLKSRGIDLCKTNYLVLPSSGVTSPDNIINGGC